MHPSVGHRNVIVARPAGAVVSVRCPSGHTPTTSNGFDDFRGAMTVMLPGHRRVARYTAHHRHDVGMGAAPAEIPDPMLIRLQAAAEHLRLAKEAVELARAQRDELMLEAHDEYGWTMARIAGAVGLTKKAVHLALLETH